MAKLTQCENCKEYQAGLNLCTRKWKDVCFDDTDCEFLLGNPGDSAGSDVESEERSVNNISKITKRGSVRYDDNFNERVTGTDTSKIQYSNSKIKSSSSLYSTVAFIVIFMISCCVGVAYFLKNVENEKEKEQAKAHQSYVLDEILQDKTLNSIKMISHYFDGDTLVVNYFAVPQIANCIRKNSLKTEFQNMVLLYHDKWKEVLNTVHDEQSVIIATFNRYDYKNTVPPISTSTLKTVLNYEEVMDTITITMDEVGTFIDNKALRKNAMEVFAKRKIYDIEEYVKMHYRNTAILKMHSVTLDKDFVRVALSFDDSRSRIGTTLLDSTRIDLNFIDKVGERGSILKEIFSICSRTHRGFTIEYVGSQKGTHHVLSWSYDRAMEFKPLFNLGVNPYDETNRTGVTFVNSRN